MVNAMLFFCRSKEQKWLPLSRAFRVVLVWIRQFRTMRLGTEWPPILTAQKITHSFELWRRLLFSKHGPFGRAAVQVGFPQKVFASLGITIYCAVARLPGKSNQSSATSPAPQPSPWCDNSPGRNTSQPKIQSVSRLRRPKNQLPLKLTWTQFKITSKWITQPPTIQTSANTRLPNPSESLQLIDPLTIKN